MENIRLAVTHLKVIPETLHYLLLAVVSLVIPMRIRPVLPAGVAALPGCMFCLWTTNFYPQGFLFPRSTAAMAICCARSWRLESKFGSTSLGIRPGYFGPPFSLQFGQPLVSFSGGLYCLLLGLACNFFVFCFCSKQPTGV